MAIIDGSAIARAFLLPVEEKVRALKKPPRLVVLRVGEDPASVAYVNKKKTTAQALGIESVVEVFDVSISQKAFLQRIKALNADANVHGILVQTPLPLGWDAYALFNAVHPLKDVDGFHAENIGLLAQGRPRLVACTPAGILELLCHSNIQTHGKHVVIVGRSVIVGRPLALLLAADHRQGNATLTICHSQTQNLFDFTRQADILISAIGKPRFFGAEAVKPGVVVIDVGINRIQVEPGRTRLVGDVDYDAVAPLAAYITPVPGGVGPMTVAQLMANTLLAYRLQI